MVAGPYSQTIDLYDLPRTLEDMYGRPHDAGSATARPITNIWGTPARWTNLGFALEGGSGFPALLGTGTLVPGSAGTLTLSQAAPNACSLLFISLAGLTTPFKCGTLVPVPGSFQLGLFTSGGGALPLGWASWPSGLSGHNLYPQYAIQDAGAVCGVALSNALRASPP